MPTHRASSKSVLDAKDFFNWDIQYTITATINGEMFVILPEEIDALDLNLEHGYEVEGFIAEAIKKRLEK